MNRIFRDGLLLVLTVALVGACDDEGMDAMTPPTPPEWSPPVAVAPGGCPIESRDGSLLYTAAGAAGTNGLDIWVMRRNPGSNIYDNRTNLGDPVSVAGANDFCPTPLMGDYLMFVSTRDGADKCGEPGAAPGLNGADIFLTRYAVTAPATGGALQLQSNGAPKRLACYPDGPNTRGAKFSPSLLTTPDGGFLFYSSDHNGIAYTGSQDLYVSEMRPDGSYGPGVAIAGLNTSFADQQPNVSRDGLSMVFASDRDGNMDIFMATRAKVTDAWSAPRNLSMQLGFLTSGVAETRPSLSWDQQRLYYGADGQVYLSMKGN